MTTNTTRTVHEGRNLKRIREILQVKQSTLANELGGDWNQKKISLLEDKEAIDQPVLEEVAKALKVTPDSIKNFDEEAAINIISNTFNEGSFLNTGHNSVFNVNPIQKWLEALEENKKLHADKNELYERMLKDKNEMIEKLEGLLKNK